MSGKMYLHFRLEVFLSRQKCERMQENHTDISQK